MSLGDSRYIYYDLFVTAHIINRYDWSIHLLFISHNNDDKDI